MHIIVAELSQQTKQLIKNSIEFKFPEENLNDDQSLDHVTIFYKPKPHEISALDNWLNGDDEIIINILENCYNNDIQALKIKLFNKNYEEFIVPEKIFHITVSAKLGITPKYSNNMLVGKHNSEEFETTIKAKVERY